MSHLAELVTRLEIELASAYHHAKVAADQISDLRAERDALQAERDALRAAAEKARLALITWKSPGDAIAAIDAAMKESGDGVHDRHT